MLEMGAYEALWLRQGTTYRSLAERFRQQPDARLSDFVPEEEAQATARRTIETLAGLGISHFGVRLHRAAEYPQRLRDARHPLELLYYQGCWQLVETPCVAVVGTRKPSLEGLQQARQLSEQLIQDRWTVVSGLAEGIDTAAHKAALKAGGRTIAVLGTPLHMYYPKSNRFLQQRIAKEFLVVSQVPVLRYLEQSWQHNRAFFPERNLTMSALTVATIIVEAGASSGTLKQARGALQQGRKLLILDRCFLDPTLTWPRELEAAGALRVKSYAEVRAALASLGRPA